MIKPNENKSSDTVIIKYFPPVAKEWNNSIYAFNNNNIK